MYTTGGAWPLAKKLIFKNKAIFESSKTADTSGLKQKRKRARRVDITAARDYLNSTSNLVYFPRKTSGTYADLRI
jgi:hypothetical protein